MVRVGRYTSIASGVRVVNENHPMVGISTHPLFYLGTSHRHELLIGSDVWIGFNAIILPGCRSIGDGAVVGAGSVVTKDIPPYAVVAGVPAKVLRYRFEPDVAALLHESRWWELPIDDLREAAGLAVQEFCAYATARLSSCHETVHKDMHNTRTERL
jgi:virginiamycin A acetyltransferase